MVLGEYVPKALTIKISRLADVLVIFGNIFRENQICREIVDSLLLCRGTPFAHCDLRSGLWQMNLGLYISSRLQFVVEGNHVLADEVTLGDYFVVMRI